MQLPVSPICRTCGAPADHGQEYCLECGNRIRPARRAPAAATWIVPSVVTLVVAAGGAAAAIASTHNDKARGPASVVALSPLPPAPPTPAGPPARKKSRTPARKLIPWPAGNGYTIVLATLPLSGGAGAARAKALAALRDGLRDVGVLVSSSYPSLQPGYYVVFAGVYVSLEEAQSDLDTAKSSFPGAYARPIAR